MFKTASQLDGKFKGVNSKFSPNDYMPRRLAINYQPPMIILEYKTKSTGKLYHRRMKIQSWSEDTDPHKVLECIKKRYSKYFANGEIKDEQLVRMIEKLKDGCFRSKNKDLKIANAEPSPGVNKKTEPEMLKSPVKDQVKKIEKNLEDNELLKRDKTPPRQMPIVESRKYKSPVKPSTFILPDLNPSIGKSKPVSISPKETVKPPSKSDPKPKPQYEADDSLADDFESIDDEADADFDDIPDDESEKIVDKDSVAELSHLDDINSSQLDLNKYGVNTVNKAKEIMEEDFRKKQITKGDQNFEYDKRQEFEPDESNEWDVDLDDF